MTQRGGLNRICDGNKRVKSRKSHLAVDVQWLMLNVFVGAANAAEVKAAPFVLVPILETYDRINKVLADQTYRG